MPKGFSELQTNRETSLPRTLQALIRNACNHPNSNQSLQVYIHRFAMLPNYWSNTKDPEFEPKLAKLILQYVHYLPQSIERFYQECENVGWSRVAEQTNQILSAFFEKHERSQPQDGVVGMLDKVYFSHRIIEELHDQLMCFGSTPSQQWDMTSANLLVHQLLGEEYSSRLDQTAIELSHKMLTNAPEPKTYTHKKSQTFDWPCFCEHFGVSLSL